MLRVKIYQQTELERTSPAPLFLELDEEEYADAGKLLLLPLAAAAKGAQMLLATYGPNAPLPLDADIASIHVRRIVCTHPDIAGEIVVELPSRKGYLSDKT